MATYLASMKQALRNTGKKLNQKSKTSSASFYHHENIPLKLYLEIASSNDYQRLVISGKATDQECLQAWERIIQKNYEANGGFDYLNYKDTLQAYGRLVAEYNLIRCYLIKLVFMVDNDYIAFLDERGYKIKTTNSIEYAESINACLIRSENLITRITMKANELKQYIKESSGEVTTFEGIMAGLSMSLGFEIKDDITLLRFNEYKKLINKKTFKENG
jgi:hypothetical protein